MIKGQDPIDNSFIIEKLNAGGYVVAPVVPSGFNPAPIFACSKLEEALAFIEQQFNPPKQIRGTGTENL